MGSLSNIIGALQTPNPNKYYGAHYIHPDDTDAPPAIKQSGKGAWISQYGDPITDPSFTSLPLDQQHVLASQPFTQRGFLGRLGTVGKAEQQANMLAEQYPGQQSQQLQADLLRNTGVYNNALQNRIGGARTIGALAPANRSLLAGTDATGGFNEGEYGTGQQSEENKIAGIPQLQAARQAATLNPAANIPIANTTLNNSLIGQGQSAGERGRLLQEQANLGYQTDTLAPAQLQRQMYETENMPGAGAYMLHMDPLTGQTSLVRNPLATLQQQLMQNSLGGTIGQPSVGPITAPSGTAYPPPASANRAPIGQSTDLSVPTVGRPGASSDAKPVNEAIDQHPNPVVQAAKNSADSRIKASIADLKAQQEELEHRHQAGIAATYTEQLKNAVGDYYKQAWQTLNNPRDSSISNLLIGEPSPDTYGQYFRGGF